MSTYTGEALRLLREEADLKAYEVASFMGVHSSRISQIEALAQVTGRTARRYLAAVQASQVAKTSRPDAQAAS